MFIDAEGHVKLADFGLSTTVCAGVLNDTYCGSAEYMSPEMLQGIPYGHGIDYYSLGAVLYEMVTGLPPHYSTDQTEMFRACLEQELTYPRKYVSAQL